MTRWLMLALLPCLYGFSPSDPAWTACRRLDARMPRAGTLWLGSDLTSWEAVPGSMAIRVEAGREPKSGGGVRAAWGTLSWPEGTMRDVEGALVWRGARWRGECALGDARFDHQHALRCSPECWILVSTHLVTGGSITFFPASPRAVPEFELAARAATGPWLLGLVLHGSASEAEVGLEARPGLAVIARYAEEVPSLGIVLESRSLLLRAEAEDHPLLGRVARVTLRWMRGHS